MRSNNNGAAKNKVRNLKRHGFDWLGISCLACLLAVSLTGAQSSHAGFKAQTLSISGDGWNLKGDMGVNGLDFLSDGRMAVATWGGDKLKSPKRGKVWILSGVLEGGSITAKKIADKMNDNGGLVVVNDTIYVSNKDGIFWIDPNGASTEPKLLVEIPWPEENYHAYHSTPVHKDGYLYSIQHQPYYNKSTWRDQPEKGSYMKVNRITGEKSFLAGGLREPNGGNIGPEGDFFVGDNQGHWISSSKFVHVNSEGGDYFGFANKKGPFYKPTLEQKPPAIWFEHKKNGTSPNQPLFPPKGPYKNQMLIGDHYHCNLQRLFLEKVGGEWQGACIPVLNSKAFSSTLNRVVWSPDSNTIYVGGMGSVTGWPAACGGNRTMQKITVTGTVEFEILAMRSVANGFELEFTDTPGSSAMDKGSYAFNRWTHKPQWGYHSGRHVNDRKVSVQSVEKGSSEKRVTLVLSPGDLKHDQGGGLIQSTIFKLAIKGVSSASGKGLHTTTVWYTLNKIGPGKDPEDYPVKVNLKQKLMKNLSLSVDSRSLYVRGAVEVKAKIRTLDGRILDEIQATGPAVLPLGPLPTGVHFLTGTLDGVSFTKKVVVAN